MAIVEQTYDFVSVQGKSQIAGDLSAFSGISTRDKATIIAEIPMATKLQFGIARFADSLEIQSMAEDLAISPYQLNEALKMHHMIEAVAAENIQLDNQRPVFVTLSILNGQLVFSRATNSINGAIMDNVAMGQLADVYIVARTFLTGFDEVQPNKRYMVNLTTNVLTEFDVNAIGYWYVGQGIDTGLLRFEDDFCKPTVVTGTGTWALLNNSVLCDINLLTNWQLNMNTILCDLPAEAGSWSLLTGKVLADLPVVATWSLIENSILSDVTLAPVVGPTCTQIMSIVINGNGSASGTTGTYSCAYSPNNATPPLSYNWSIVGQGASVQGSNTGATCVFNFGTSGNAIISLTVSSCNETTVSTTKTVSQTPIVASAQKVFFIRNITAGFNNDLSTASGFNTYMENNILDFKAAGFDGVRLTYIWSEIETSQNNYSTALLQKQIDYCLSINLKFSICIWFYNRDSETTPVMNGLAKQVLNNGLTNNNAFDYNDANVRNHLQAGTSALANLIDSNQNYKDNFLYFLLGNGVTEEFYNDYKTDGSYQTGNYSAASLTAWRQFLFAKYGVNTPYSYGGTNISGNMPLFHLDSSNPPSSQQNNLNSAVGKDWQYFVADGLKKLFMAFKTGTKNVNPNFECWYFPTAWYTGQTYFIELMWFAHHQIIAEADGVYTSCNEGNTFYNNLHFMDNMATTWPTKNAGLEWDPDDISAGIMGAGNGNAAQNGAAPADFSRYQSSNSEFIKRAAPNVRVIIHAAMAYGNGSGGGQGQHNQIAGMQGPITAMKASYLAGQNRYNRTNAPSLTGSLVNNMDTGYWKTLADWIALNGHQDGHPINYLLNP